MTQVLAIAAGGAVGSVLRFWLTGAIQGVAGKGFPYGTLAVNVIGCLIAGFLVVVLLERLVSDEIWRAGLMVGLLGGFTTFSAFSVEALSLMEHGAWLKAGLYVAASVILCLAAVWLGALLARQ